MNFKASIMLDGSVDQVYSDLQDMIVEWVRIGAHEKRAGVRTPGPFPWQATASEQEPEPELHRQRRIGDVRVGARLPERGAVYVRRV